MGKGRLLTSVRDERMMMIITSLKGFGQSRSEQEQEVTCSGATRGTGACS